MTKWQYTLQHGFTSQELSRFLYTLCEEWIKKYSIRASGPTLLVASFKFKHHKGVDIRVPPKPFPAGVVVFPHPLLSQLVP